MLNRDPADHIDHAFQTLCHEAVLACGADIAAIERYVKDRLASAAPANRERIRREIDLVLAGALDAGARETQ